MRSLDAPLAALALLSASPPAPGAPSFDYRGTTVCPVSRSDDGPTVEIHGPGDKPTNAVLVMPRGLGRKVPAVLWVHWLGEPATTNHREFMTDAQELAKRGVVSMLLDMPWSQKDWFSSARSPDTDYADTIAQV
ncbi:MAG: hypothetical protein QOD51_66, partial [Candidatus Eremiobacteraeota bacterium]|nr:hypothetical protein [Candidatus Eremiobacteraeota bacterium]